MCTASDTATSTPFTLAPWVESSEEAVRGGAQLVHLVNRRDGVALAMTGDEADLLQEGRATDALLAELTEGGFLHHSPVPARPSGRRRALEALATLQVRFHRADPFVQWLHRHLGRHLCTRTAVALQLVVALAGVVAVTVLLSSGQDVHYRVSPHQVPVVLILSTIAIAVHELAHAVVLARHGRRVDAIGVGLHLGSPVFFVESVDELLLHRRARILQAAAGPWSEWLFTSLLALTLLAHPSADREVITRFLAVNTFCIATNLLPFVGLDGYHILSDALRLPDLACRSVGAPERVLVALLSRRRPTRMEVGLAAYRIANGVIASALLLVSAILWWTLFGPTLVELAHGGPAAWLTLLAIAVLLGRPVIHTGLPRLHAGLSSAVRVASRLRFRMEWAWRIPAAQTLAQTVPFVDADEDAMGVVAGLLRRARAARGLEIGVSGAVVDRGWVLVDGIRLGAGAPVPPLSVLGAHSLAARVVTCPSDPQVSPRPC